MSASQFDFFMVASEQCQHVHQLFIASMSPSSSWAKSGIRGACQTWGPAKVVALPRSRDDVVGEKVTSSTKSSSAKPPPTRDRMNYEQWFVVLEDVKSQVAASH